MLSSMVTGYILQILAAAVTTGLNIPSLYISLMAAILVPSNQTVP